MAFVPPGAIIAISTGTAWSIPGSDEIKNGWVLANGLPYPPGSRLTGNRPNLSDNRFLMGSTSFSPVDGRSDGNALILQASNIPTISGSFTSGNNSVGHTHTVAAGTAPGEGTEHKHSYTPDAVRGNHTHTSRVYSAGGNSAAHDHNLVMYDKAANTGGVNPCNTTAGTGINLNDTEAINLSATHGHGQTLTTGDIDVNHIHYGTTYGVTANHTHGYSKTSSGDSSNHTHSTTVTLGSGSPASIDNRPFYLQVVFLIRV
jgi:hypothetical protein